MADSDPSRLILAISAFISALMLMPMSHAGYVVAEMSIISSNTPPVSIASPSNSLAIEGQYESFNGIIASGYTPYNVYLYIVDSASRNTVVYSENSMFTGPEWEFNGILITSAWAANSPLAANVVVVDARSVTTNSTYTAAFTVNPRPALAVLAPSNTILDYGQVVSYNALITGGAGPFTVNLMDGNSVAESISGLSAGKVDLSSRVLRAGIQNFSVVATDAGLTTPQTFTSPPNSILAYPFSAAIAASPSSAVTYGSNVVENVIVTGGSDNFIFGWTINGAGASNALVGTSGSSNSLIMPPAGTYVYNVVVTDMGTTAPYEYALSGNVAVAKAGLGGSISISQQSVLAAGEGTIGNQSKWSLYVNNALYATANSQISIATSSFGPGTYALSLRNPGDGNYFPYSTNATLIIQSGSSGGGGGGGSGGGSSGGPSGGNGKPDMLYINNQAVVTGITVPNQFNLTIRGVRLNFTPNFITPTYAGMSVNGRHYSLYPGNLVIISQDQNPGYIFYVKLLNLTITPIQDYFSISLDAAANATRINVTSQDFSTMVKTSNTIPVVINLLGGSTSLNITSSFTVNQIFASQNLTDSRFLPPLPANYVALNIQNISMTPLANALEVNTIINVTMQYDCGIAFYRIYPLLLQRYNWSTVSSYSVKPNKCSVTFSVAQDPIIAVAEYIGSNGTSAPAYITTSPPTSSSTQTTTAGPITNIAANGNPPLYAYYLLTAIILAVAVAYLPMRLRRKKTERGPKPRSTHKKRASRGRRAESNKKPRRLRRRKSRRRKPGSRRRR